MAPYKTHNSIAKTLSSMKKKNQDDDQQNLEIIKTVAQAWHGHSTTNTRLTNEFNVRRLNFKSKPSRFKLEAMNLNSSAKDNSRNTNCGTRWDFGQSLWDSYEIVNMSKKLEAGLVLDYRLDHEPSRMPKRRKESKNSLRNLLNLMSSRRFDEASIPRDLS